MYCDWVHSTTLGLDQKVAHRNRAKSTSYCGELSATRSKLFLESCSGESIMNETAGNKLSRVQIRPDHVYCKDKQKIVEP
jgi:hypothetical protein